MPMEFYLTAFLLMYHLVSKMDDNEFKDLAYSAYYYMSLSLRTEETLYRDRQYFSNTLRLHLSGDGV